MKQTKLFRSIFGNALRYTWHEKIWWFFGLLALFLSSSVGYQLVLQGIQGLAQPSQWWQRWQGWASGLSPWEFISGQWNILLSDPKGWLAMVTAWTIILLVFLFLFLLVTYAFITVISAMKVRMIQQQRPRAMVVLREALSHLKTVFGAVLLVQFVANIITIAFSVPVIWLGMEGAGLLGSVSLTLIFAVFLVIAFIISMVALYTILYIVMEDKNLADSIVAAWRMLKRHWLLTIEMFLLQVLVAIVFALAVVVTISLIAIPIVIIGYILVVNQVYDITAVLPQAVLYLLMLLALFASAVYTVFQLYAWTLLFVRFEEIHPHSRFARLIEVRLLRR